MVAAIDPLLTFELGCKSEMTGDPMTEDVESFRARLDPDVRQTIDAIRLLVRRSQPRLTERIKWAAPSFAINDDDRITLGLERNGGVRVVLHRGAKPKTIDGFRFNDPAGLAKWAAPDRGIVVFQNCAEVDAKEAVFIDLCSRWIDATS